MSAHISYANCVGKSLRGDNKLDRVTLVAGSFANELVKDTWPGLLRHDTALAVCSSNACLYLCTALATLLMTGPNNCLTTLPPPLIAP